MTPEELQLKANKLQEKIGTRVKHIIQQEFDVFNQENEVDYTWELIINMIKRKSEYTDSLTIED